MKSIIILLTIIFVIGCSSKKTDKELFDAAQTNLRTQNYSEAVVSFEEIISDHPESELAPEAISQLASIYQNKQIKNLSDKENLEKAIELFKKLHDNYPSTEYGPSGLFMAGFIYANELQNYKEATILYEQFLEQYPDNELAPSAQAELDNMGLAPEDILLKNMAKEK